MIKTHLNYLPINIDQNYNQISMTPNVSNKSKSDWNEIWHNFFKINEESLEDTYSNNSAVSPLNQKLKLFKPVSKENNKSKLPSQTSIIDCDIAW